MFHLLCGQSQDSIHKPLLFQDSRSGSNRGPSAYQPSALLRGHTNSQCGRANAYLNIQNFLCFSKAEQSLTEMFIVCSGWTKTENKKHAGANAVVRTQSAGSLKSEWETARHILTTSLPLYTPSVCLVHSLYASRQTAILLCDLHGQN